MDLKFDENLDVHLDPDTNDIALVDGNEEVEQSISVSTKRLTESFIGSFDRDEVISKLERKAQRVVQESDKADSIVSVHAENSEEDPNTVLLRIVYGSNDITTEEVTL